MFAPTLLFFAAKWVVKITKFVFSIIWGTIQVQKTLRIAVLPCIEKIFYHQAAVWSTKKESLSLSVFTDRNTKPYGLIEHSIRLWFRNLQEKMVIKLHLCKIERDMTHIKWGENYVFSGLFGIFLTKFALIFTSNLKKLCHDFPLIKFVYKLKSLHAWNNKLLWDAQKCKIKCKNASEPQNWLLTSMANFRIRNPDR